MVATIDSRHGSTTAMLIIGAADQNGKPLYLCQDSGASINAIDCATVQQTGATLQKLRKPMQKKSECVFCGLISSNQMISRWHNNNCKKKQND